MRANEYGCGAAVPRGTAESGAGRGFGRGFEGLSPLDGEAKRRDHRERERQIKEWMQSRSGTPPKRCAAVLGENYKARRFMGSFQWTDTKRVV